MQTVSQERVYSEKLMLSHCHIRCRSNLPSNPNHVYWHKAKKKFLKIHDFFWPCHFWGSNSMTFFFFPNSMSFSRFPWPVWTLQIAVTTWFNTSCSHCRQLLLSALTYFHPCWHTARHIPKLHIPKLHIPKLHRLLWIYCPGHPSQREWVGTLTGKHSRHHILSAAWQGRRAWRLEELSEYGQARASQQWSPEGKRSGERKWPIFNCPRSETICLQPDKHWHCFEVNLGDTVERRGRAHMGLPKPCDAV